MSSDPDVYKNMRVYSVNNDLEDIYRQWDSIVSPEEEPMLTEIVNALVANVPEDGRALERELLAQRKRQGMSAERTAVLKRFPAHRLAMFRDTFESFDADGSGEVDLDELNLCLNW